MFVDDMLGCCAEEEVDANLVCVKLVVEDLLGEGALSDRKTKKGRRLDMIVYTLDLDTQRYQLPRRMF